MVPAVPAPSIRILFMIDPTLFHQNPAQKCVPFKGINMTGISLAIDIKSTIKKLPHQSEKSDAGVEIMRPEACGYSSLKRTGRV
jgi:hypothetical protein